MAGWVNNKPVKLDGIQFKSEFEAEMWKYPKMPKIKAAYEPESYVLLKSFRFDGHKYPPITYTPDFVGKDLTGREFVIEREGFENDAFTLRRKLFLDYLRKIIFVERAYVCCSDIGVYSDRTMDSLIRRSGVVICDILYMGMISMMNLCQTMLSSVLRLFILLWT